MHDVVNLHEGNPWHVTSRLVAVPSRAADGLQLRVALESALVQLPRQDAQLPQLSRRHWHVRLLPTQDGKPVPALETRQRSNARGLAAHASLLKTAVQRACAPAADQLSSRPCTMLPACSPRQAEAAHTRQGTLGHVTSHVMLVKARRDTIGR